MDKVTAALMQSNRILRVKMYTLGAETFVGRKFCDFRVSGIFRESFYQGII